MPAVPRTARGNGANALSGWVKIPSRGIKKFFSRGLPKDELFALYLVQHDKGYGDPIIYLIGLFFDFRPVGREAMADGVLRLRD